jgi:ABC-type nickel/cobalt efflux system permease component RcnA
LETTLNDWTGIISAGMEFAPAAGIVLLAGLAAWLLWRLVRRVLQAFNRSHAPQDLVQRGRAFERREPILEPAAARNPPPASVSEIHALRASIDALTRQVADLSGKLAAPDETRLHAANRPSPLAVSHGDRAISVERRGPRAVSLSR